MIIGIDHVYYAIKTRNGSFPAGITAYAHQPYTDKNVLALRRGIFSISACCADLFYCDQLKNRSGGQKMAIPRRKRRILPILRERAPSRQHQKEMAAKKQKSLYFCPHS